MNWELQECVSLSFVSHSSTFIKPKKETGETPVYDEWGQTHKSSYLGLVIGISGAGSAVLGTEPSTCLRALTGSELNGDRGNPVVVPCYSFACWLAGRNLHTSGGGGCGHRSLLCWLLWCESTGDTAWFSKFPQTLLATPNPGLSLLPRPFTYKFILVSFILIS